MANFRIEDSAVPYLDEDILKLLHETQDQTGKAVVSGQPLNLWRTDGLEYHFDDCPKVEQIPMHIGRISLLTIPTNHSHVPNRYVVGSSYACLQGFDSEENEYRMGMIKILDFEIHKYRAKT